MDRENLLRVRVSQLPKAKLEAVEVNKKQWGIGAEGVAEGGAVAVRSSPLLFCLSYRSYPVVSTTHDACIYSFSTLPL